MNICKASIQEGKSKGNKCGKKTTNTHCYCEKHLRNKKYDEGIESGICWCRFFFRGCNNEITDELSKILSCKDCLEAKKKNANNCRHDGCKFKAKDNGKFCGKHERDKYRLEEIEKGIKYCDINRGCFVVCKDGKSSCEECLEKCREKDNVRVQQIKTINNQLHTTSDRRLCHKCGIEFEKFNTLINKESTKCKNCFETQQKIEQNRDDRGRNYKEERKQFLETYFRMFIKESSKREKNVELNFEDFSKLAQSSCYYCGYYNKKEAIGIDRVNNTLHYTKENCVPCCVTCNRIKHVYHPLFFIDKAKIISNMKEPTKEFYNKWCIYYTRSKNNLYSKYKKESEEKRHIPFLLTELEWDKLIRKSCYLCKYMHVEGLGLDRVDNNIREYTIENTRACCGGCNNMKHDMQYDDFIAHMKKISDNWPVTTELEKIPMFHNPFKKNITEPDDIEDKKERVRWTSNGLYYAFLTDLEQDFIDFYQDYIKDDEVLLLKEEVMKLDYKEAILKRISTYLNTLSVRRKRAKK